MGIIIIFSIIGIYAKWNWPPHCTALIVFSSNSSGDRPRGNSKLISQVCATGRWFFPSTKLTSSIFGKPKRGTSELPVQKASNCFSVISHTSSARKRQEWNY